MLTSSGSYSPPSYCCSGTPNSGVHHKTRKRNIAVPLDPGAFANEVIQTLADAWKEGQTLQENLDAGVKVLVTSNLDFNRYGDTLFEVLFAGGRMAAGASRAQDNGTKFQTHVSREPPHCLRGWLSCEALWSGRDAV